MLSIIIPTLNEEKNLPRLLENIQNQTFQDHEVIVADAGSTDRTVEIAKSYHCRVVQGGLPAEGRNKGAEVAQGEILMFTDADNYFKSPDFLENSLRFFQEKKLGVASFSIYPQGNLIDKLAYGAYNLWTHLTQTFLPHATNTILVRRDVHQRIQGFDERVRFAEDHEYARRASRYAKFGFIREVILTSSRRLEKDGRLKTYLKYVLAGIYMLVLGPIKSDVFNYDFYYSLKKKNE